MVFGNNGEEARSEMEISPETKLHRFILHGRLDVPVGKLQEPSSISEEDLKTLENVISKVDISKFFDTVSYFHEQDWTSLKPLPETIPFVLALTSKSHLHQTCELARKIFTKPEEFLRFTMHCVETSQLSTEEVFTQCVKNFYSSFDYSSLAKMVAEDYKVQSWSHARAIKLSNYASSDAHIDAVIRYAVDGRDGLDGRDDPATKTVLRYFKEIEDFRRINDAKDAILKIIKHRGSIRNASTIFDDRNIIDALVKRLDLKEALIFFDVLCRIDKKMGNGEFFEERILQIFSILKNPSGNIHPCEWFLSEQRYWRSKGTGPIDLEDPLLNRLLVAVESSLQKSIKNLTKIELDIRVIIEPQLFTCMIGGFIHGDSAAAMIAHVLKKTGRKVDIYTFDGSAPVLINETQLVPIARATMITTPINPEAMANFVQESETDMVVFISSSIIPDVMKVAKKKKSFSKLVLCSLSDSPNDIIDHEDVLVTTGFHENVCDVITAFACLNFGKSHQPIITKL